MQTNQKRIISISLLIFGATCLGALSKPDENNVAMKEEWTNHMKQDGGFEIRPVEEVSPHFKHVWGALNSVRVSKGKFYGLLHSRVDDGEKSYATIILRKDGKMEILSVPKEIFTASGWDALMKRDLTDFATKWKYEIPGPPEPVDLRVGLPLDRTITNTDGKAIEVKILEIKNGNLSIQLKGEKKTLQYPISKLSEADQTFLKENINPAKNGPKILVYGLGQDMNPEWMAQWNDLNIQVTFLASKNDDYIPNVISLNKTTDTKALLEQYDALWMTFFYMSKESGENKDLSLVKTMNDLGKPIVIQHYSKFTKESFLKGDIGKEMTSAFVSRSDNFIFYNEKTSKCSSEVRGADEDGPPIITTKYPENIKKATDEMKKLLR